MRHHTAVFINLSEDGNDGAARSGWHYASLSSRGGYPLGYCREHGLHATESEARICYRDWQRDNVVLHLDGVKWTTCSLPLCPHPAKNAAQIAGDGFSLAALCDDHFHLEYAIEALGLMTPEAGDAWVS